ncbi:MAG: FtsQ-type POTRA domain-containing protein [Actinobacteria bacterium]|nr:FtsQ-type POTRA domain-containing protein [Actinomycetota bacterium]
MDLGRLLPNGRSVVITLIVASLACGVYLLARESSLFAVRTIDVRGAPSSVAGQVRAALAPFEGESLVTLDGVGVDRRLAALPVVAEARYDRDFPHTLRVFVQPEEPVAVVRKGPESWLVSARARVIKTLDGGQRNDLPRIWASGSTSVTPGGTLGGDPARAVVAAAPLIRTPLSHRVAAVRATPDELTLVLRSGLELRLGDARNLPLKLAVGQQIAAVVGPVSGYIDLTVPGRPVSKLNPRPGE